MTARPGGLAGLLTGLALFAWASLAPAATWGGITPGQTTRGEVEARYGRPTRERVVTQEGRTGSEWTYAGDQAPRGIDRMVIGFGLLGPQGLVPDLVRSLALYPRARIFSVEFLVAGWGKPDAIGTEEQTGRPSFRYDGRALFVILDHTGQWAEMLLFGPEKPASR